MSERYTGDEFAESFSGTFQLETIPQVEVENLDLVEKAAIERAVVERESLLQSARLEALEIRTERDALRRQLSTFEDERERLRQRIDELEVERPTLEPRAVVSALGSALESADGDLDDARYRVDDVDVTLRANVVNTREGMRMHLPSLDEHSAAANLSEFAFRFSTPSDAEARPESEYVSIPDLVGLDLETAERRLAAASLEVGRVETVTGAGAESGTVVEQFPDPLAVAQPGSTVDLVVAADDETDDAEDADSEAEAEAGAGTGSGAGGETEPDDEDGPDATDDPADPTLPDEPDAGGSEWTIDPPEGDVETVLLERLERAGIDDVAALTEADPERIAKLLGAPVDAVAPLLEELSDRVESADSIDLETVDGIGPTYAGRLREAGVDDVAALARADPEFAAKVTGASPSRTEGWIEQARKLVESR